MRVELLVGEGWNPFAPLPGDDGALVAVDRAERLDGEASAPRLAAVLRRLVHEEYPDAAVEVLPPDVDEGQVVLVRFDPADCDRERFEDLTGVSPDAVAAPAEDGPAFVGEAVYVLLGEALETPGWRLDRG
jgi:hypothetical protein